MCKYCDYESNDCEIFQDPLDNSWYLDHETGEWDDYNDGFVYDKIYINYCPYCGRDLENKVDFLKDKTPVFRFTTAYTLYDVCNFANQLSKKYPNLIVLPQDFDVDWMTRKDFENWIKLMRERFDEKTKSECECNGRRDMCNLSPKYQCEEY